MAAYQSAKLWLIQHFGLGLAKDALHIYVALAIFFGACLLFRWKTGMWKPWLCVLCATLAGEAWDIRDNLVVQHYAILDASWHDLWNTMVAPTALMLLSRYTRIFSRG